jgi:methylenetetrahydrofolate dehydrogenase (NADP+)/methenyltetrahydrofolate cyclohydrolase
MSAKRLEGGPTARRIRDAAGQRARALVARGVRPGLGVVLAGEDPASAVYVRGNTRACCCVVPRPVFLFAHHPNPIGEAG